MQPIELTTEERQVINGLRQTQEGKIIKGFLERMIDTLVDARNIESLEDLNAAKKAVALIQINFLDRLTTPVPEANKTGVENYE